jgi:D-beta-D-heptose 7-phosphate kinase / D-beta-D-heptose 1-phosphate adenosyltransferase
MRVFTNGCFDVLTVGHFNLLMFCKDLAGDGKLYVAIDEDEKVMAEKGLKRPVFNVHERAKALLDLRMPNQTPVVDEILFFHSNLELQMLIKRVAPNYMVKGGDWRDKFVVGANTTRVLFYDRLEGYSTTEIIKRCQEKSLTP